MKTIRRIKNQSNKMNKFCDKIKEVNYDNTWRIKKRARPLCANCRNKKAAFKTMQKSSYLLCKTS